MPGCSNALLTPSSLPQELSRSYLSGAALMLPPATFGNCFPQTTQCVLRNADGEEWEGKVMRRLHGTHSTGEAG